MLVSINGLEFVLFVFFSVSEYLLNVFLIIIILIIIIILMTVNLYGRICVGA